MEKVLQFLDTYDNLEPGLRDYLFSILKTTQPKKAEILVKEGSIAKSIGFIEKGLVRGYRTREDGTEFTCWFMQEGDIFIQDLTS